MSSGKMFQKFGQSLQFGIRIALCGHIKWLLNDHIFFQVDFSAKYRRLFLWEFCWLEKHFIGGWDDVSCIKRLPHRPKVGTAMWHFPAIINNFSASRQRAVIFYLVLQPFGTWCTVLNLQWNDLQLERPFSIIMHLEENMEYSKITWDFSRSKFVSLLLSQNMRTVFELSGTQTLFCC